VTRLSKQQIASVRTAWREIHAELLGWDPHVLVLFESEPQKAEIITCMLTLGWRLVDDPSNDPGAVSIVEFNCDPIALEPTALSAGGDDGRDRRVRFPTQFFASGGILFFVLGFVLAAADFPLEHRMKLLEDTGTPTNGEIERTYSTSASIQDPGETI
jgi:hypothetical protein